MPEQRDGSVSGRILYTGAHASSLLRSPWLSQAPPSPTRRYSEAPVYTVGALPVIRDRSTPCPSGRATSAPPSASRVPPVPGSPLTLAPPTLPPVSAASPAPPQTVPRAQPSTTPNDP